MRFNCGPTLADRIEASNRRDQEWHWHFTLIPRRVGNNQCVWLERIQRKGTLHEVRGLRIHTWWSWEYRLPSTEGVAK